MTTEELLQLCDKVEAHEIGPWVVNIAQALRTALADVERLTAELAVLRAQVPHPCGVPTFTPVMQTSFAKGSGDCLAACLASVLGISLESIPDLHANASTLQHQINNEDAFLATRGLKAIRILFTGAYEECDVFFVFDGYAIAWGASPRQATSHAVVVEQNDGQLVMAHDQHPDGRGVLRYDGLEFIVPATCPPPAKGGA